MTRVRLTLGLGAVVLATACAPGPATDAAAPGVATALPIDAVALRFDRDAGDTIRVLAVATEDVLMAVSPTEGGFLRGLLPALEQDRRIGRGDPDAPFYFSRDDDGEPILTDPTTGTRIDLLAFGPGARDLIDAVIAAGTPVEDS